MHTPRAAHLVLASLSLVACKAGTSPEPAPASDSHDAAAATPDTAASVDDHMADAAARTPDTAQRRDARAERPAPPDAFFGESRCPAGVMLCEDFEGNTLDPGKWKTDLAGGTLVFDSKDFARGMGSLDAKVTSQAQSSHAWAETVKTFPVKAGASLWVRAFYRIDKAMPNRWFIGLKMTDATNNQERLFALIPSSETEPALWAVYYWVASEGMNIASQKVHAPLDAWACYEMEVRGTSELHFYLDGEEVTEMTAKGWPDLHDVKLSFGASITHEDIFKHPNGFNIRVDAIAVSATRVGCEM